MGKIHGAVEAFARDCLKYVGMGGVIFTILSNIWTSARATKCITKNVQGHTATLFQEFFPLKPSKVFLVEGSLSCTISQINVSPAGK